MRRQRKDPGRRLRKVPLGARADLLRVLTSPSNVRADVIRQLCERSELQDMADVLMELEADDVLRWRLVDLLRETKGPP